MIRYPFAAAAHKVFQALHFKIRPNIVVQCYCRGQGHQAMDGAGTLVFELAHVRVWVVGIAHQGPDFLNMGFLHPQETNAYGVAQPFVQACAHIICLKIGEFKIQVGHAMGSIYGHFYAFFMGKTCNLGHWNHLTCKVNQVGKVHHARIGRKEAAVGFYHLIRQKGVRGTSATLMTIPKGFSTCLNAATMLP